MTDATKASTADTTLAAAATDDSYMWLNPYGGAWGTPANWTDATTGGVATVAPGATSDASIAGGTDDTYLNVTGNGASAQLGVMDDVALWGTVAVGGGVVLAPNADEMGAALELVGGARLSAGSLAVAAAGTLELNTASALAVSGSTFLAPGVFLAALNGSTVQLGGLVANDATIEADSASTIRIGAADVSAVSGTVGGGMLIGGTLVVPGGATLNFAQDGGGGSVTGTGTLVLRENSNLILGIADTTGVDFGGPDGTLDLAVLPTGTIDGFAAGDIIELGGLATGLSYQQTSAGLATLTLTLAGESVGTLALFGNYSGDLFDLSVNGAGDAFVSLQVIGSAPTQPRVITGSSAADDLTATANDQTLTGLGGDDTLDAGAFTGIDFKDTSGDLNGSTIENFGSTDTIDLTDMAPGTASVSYVPASKDDDGTLDPGLLTVADGTQSATIFLDTILTSGYFETVSDKAGGTGLKFVPVNSDAYSFAATLGGRYNTPGNWLDTTTGTAASAAPDAGNAVTIAGTGGCMVITGSGVAGSLTTSNGLLLLLGGTLTVAGDIAGATGTLTQDADLALDGGATLTVAGLISNAGEISVGGGSKLLALGGLTSASNAPLVVTDGSFVQFSDTSGPDSYSFYDGLNFVVDSTSSIEFGTAGRATEGALTVDSGVTANLSGTVEGKVVVNGTLFDKLVVEPLGGSGGTLSGSGVVIATSGTLTLDGPSSVAIDLASGYYGYPYAIQLAIDGPLPTGPISGLGGPVSISLNRVVTSLTYAQTTAAAGTLTLFSGSAEIGTLDLEGSYAANQFQITYGDGGLVSTIAYPPVPTTIPGSPISGNSDTFSWTNINGGAWNVAADWSDNGMTATSAPGANNAVVIDDNPYQTQTISGSGAALYLTVNAATVFTGTIAVGRVFSDENLVILSGGAVLTAGSLLDKIGEVDVGGGSTLDVINADIGADMQVFVDSTVVVSGNTNTLDGMISVDPTSRFQIGTAKTFAEGALTIDNGRTGDLAGGTIAANLVIGGALDVVSGLIEGFNGAVGSITGPGSLEIGTGDHLTLDAADSCAIALPADLTFDVSAAELELKGPLPTGVISGFNLGTGDQSNTIVIDRTVTSLSFKQTSSAGGTLTLTDGSAIVGTLDLAGSFAGEGFNLHVSAASGAADITVQTDATASTPSPVSTGDDTYR